MTRKDYMLLASIINDMDDAWIREYCAKQIAYGLQKADRSFKLQLFIDICMDASRNREDLLRMDKRPDDTKDW